MALYAVYNVDGGVHIHEARSPRHAYNICAAELVESMELMPVKVSPEEAAMIEELRDAPEPSWRSAKASTVP